MKKTKKNVFNFAVMCNNNSQIFKVVKNMDFDKFYNLMSNYLGELDDDDKDCIKFCDRTYNSYGDDVDGFIDSCFENNHAFVVYWNVKNGKLSDWKWRKCKIKNSEIDCKYILTTDDFVKMISENEIIDEEIVNKYITIIDKQHEYDGDGENSYTINEFLEDYEFEYGQPIIKDCGTFIKISEGYYRKSDINKINFHWVDSNEDNEYDDDDDGCYALNIYYNNGLKYTECISRADDIDYYVDALYGLVERIILMINK